MNKDERTAKIEEYGRGCAMLEAVLAAIPEAALKFRPAVVEWSVREILGHMADSECLGVVRLHKVIAEPGSVLMPYDEGKWAKALGYQDQDPEVALALFRLLRQRTHTLLHGLPDEVFAHSVTHPEFAQPYDVDIWLDIYTRHVPEHIAQLQGTLEAWPAWSGSAR